MTKIINYDILNRVHQSVLIHVANETKYDAGEQVTSYVWNKLRSEVDVEVQTEVYLQVINNLWKK